jgi:hypothetical protein
MNAGIERAMN